MAPYLQILFGLICLAAIYGVFRSLLFNMHMFQLNGYRTGTQLKWIKKNISRYTNELIVCCLSAVTGIMRDDKMVAFGAAALLIAVFSLIFSNKPVQAKKPLVYTPRVKRMFGCICVLYALSFAYVIYLLSIRYYHTSFLVLGYMCAFAPFYVLVANLINRPMEKGINRHYTNEAKRMLKACPDLETIGITGSYGKTSVKFYLYTILRAWTDTLVTPESYNTPMGIVKTVRGSLSAIHKIFLCEMGAKWVGDIKELCDIVHPKHGIITSLGEQHLESFGSKENIIKTKYELADALPENGRLYVNFDNEVIRNNLPKRKFIKYGTLDDCDYKASDIKVSSTGTSFRVTAPNGESEVFETKLLGEHNVINITGAVAAAHGFGMKLSEMKLYIRRIESVPHRMQLIDKGNITIIDDAFNSNPAGCKAALQTLSQMDGTKILVTPGMIELGKEEFALNKEFGKQAAKACDYIVLIGAKQTAAIKEGALSIGYSENKILTFESFNEGMSKVYSLSSDKKKIVLLENDLPDNY